MARNEVAAERALLAHLEGGCTTPIGAHATRLTSPSGGARLELLGLLSDTSGTRVHRASHEAAADDPDRLGAVMASTLLTASGAAP